MDKKKILLVDDVRLFLEQQIKLLSRDDFEVFLAHDGIEALKIAREKIPDIIFMDLYMPKMDGDRCCYAIKSDERLCHIPIIMVTQGINDEDFDRCWQAGCDDVITKPINRNYFMAVAKRHLSVQMRKVPRYVASLRVEYHSGTDPDRVLADYSVNLSTGGVFIETAELLPIDSQLLIRFTLPESGQIIKCAGRVAWINHPESIKNQNLPIGMGLQFINMTLDDMDAIRNFIKRKALEPEW